MRVVWKYTLTELLVVMAIMGILLSIAMPAFNRLTQGNKVTAASNNLGGAMGQARSQAILNRKYVAVIMPVTGVPARYLFKSYRLCYVTPPSDISSTTFTFDRWLEDSIWHFFPAGTIIADADTISGYSATPAWPKSLNTINSVRFTDDAGTTSTVNLYGIVFTPYGACRPMGGNFCIMVTEGSNDTSGSTTPVFTNQSGGAPQNFIEIIINRFTGRANYRG